MNYRKFPKNIVLYGAGKYFNIFVERANGCNIKYIIDKSEKKDISYKIIHPDNVCSLENEFVVITLENNDYIEQAKQYLEEKGLSHYKDYALGYEYLKWMDSEHFIEVCGNETPLFSQIEIETINRCNMHCSFCPCNVESDKRPYAKMSDKLFKKIADELGQLNYAGDITLFSNNEPFLDDRTPYFAKILNESCPKARIIIFTNTTLLNLDLFIQTIPYVQNIVLDNYWVDKPRWNKNVQNIYEYIKDKPDFAKKVIFEMRYQKELLTARAGSAPNKKESNYVIPDWRCSRTFYDYVIRPDGCVSLCCNDAQAQITIGNVADNSLVEVWYSKKFETVRKNMIRLGRKGVELCSKCDAIYEGAPYYVENANGRYKWDNLNSEFLTTNKKNTIEYYERFMENGQ